MTTKEEVAQIITYCDESKISYKQRLSGLGINAGIIMTPNANMRPNRKMKAQASSC